MGSAVWTDPVLQLIRADELPEIFLLLPDDEQRWRGRLFLAVLWASHSVAFSWWTAFGDDAETTTELRPIMEETPDELFIARAHGLRAELAVETGVGLARA
jgi:hypothetical protein